MIVYFIKINKIKELFNRNDKICIYCVVINSCPQSGSSTTITVSVAFPRTLQEQSKVTSLTTTLTNHIKVIQESREKDLGRVNFEGQSN